MNEFSGDVSYWEERWINRQTGWDIGYPAPAISSFMLPYPNKEHAVLIPGCGNAYEASFLLDQGFSDLTLIDISPTAVAALRNKFAGRSEKQIRIVCEDFFNHEGQYDLLIEQTFFCAIPPSRRVEYVAKAASLLKQGGAIVGLLFNKLFDQPGPPFGGTAEAYRSLFEPFFKIQQMEICTNSIPPRAGSELFIHLIKK